MNIQCPRVAFVFLNLLGLWDSVGFFLWGGGVGIVEDFGERDTFWYLPYILYLAPQDGYLF